MYIISGGGISNPTLVPIQGKDKDNNTINLIGYVGELSIVGDLEFGNETLIASGIIDGINQYIGYRQIGSEEFGDEIQFNDVTDPENPVELQKITTSSNRINSEFKFEDRETTRPEGYVIRYNTAVDQVAISDLFQTLDFIGYNDELSETTYVSDEISCTSIVASAESGVYRKYVMQNGVRTLALTIDENGITHDLVTRKSAILRVSGLGTSYLEYDQVESNINSNTYHSSQAGGTVVPADTDTGFTRLCVFARATGGDAELYINLGASSSCKFRKVTTS